MTLNEITNYLVTLHDDTYTQVMDLDVTSTDGGFLVSTEDGDEWFALAELAAAHILDLA